MASIFSVLKVLLRIDSRLMNLTSLMHLLLEHHQAVQPAPLSGKWIDNQDVMLRLKISDSTLRRLRDEGCIRYTRLRGKYLYNEADLQEVLYAGRAKTIR